MISIDSFKSWQSATCLETIIEDFCEDQIIGFKQFKSALNSLTLKAEKMKRQHCETWDKIVLEAKKAGIPLEYPASLEGVINELQLLNVPSVIQLIKDHKSIEEKFLVTSRELSNKRSEVKAMRFIEGSIGLTLKGLEQVSPNCKPPKKDGDKPPDCDVKAINNLKKELFFEVKQFCRETINLNEAGRRGCGNLSRKNRLNDTSGI